jgi:GH15 family glucan-1,4-alpha-glucosidase
VTREQLYKRSLEVIKDGQHSSGGFVACPTFPTYHYCWFRDSAYIAYSMDLAGEYASASDFHHWAVRNILKRESNLNDFFQGKSKNYKELLHTRYTLEGEEGSQEWENFQLDSFGIWIWSLEEHLNLSGTEGSEDVKKAVSLVSSYLVALWQKSCYDCWEENSDKVHIYTLATIYRGLQSTQNILNSDFTDVCSSIKTRILTSGCSNGHLSKFEGTDAVDSSLLGVSFPCGVLSVDNPVMSKTIDKIISDLYRAGGVHRYQLDTYYGGGIWILLTAWLGICLLDKGENDKAEGILEWIISKADEKGHLAEQLSDSLNDEFYLPGWIEKWGSSADPLLWSHAMYIILYNKLKNL